MLGRLRHTSEWPELSRRNKIAIVVVHRATETRMFYLYVTIIDDPRLAPRPGANVVVASIRPTLRFVSFRSR